MDINMKKIRRANLKRKISDKVYNISNGIYNWWSMNKEWAVIVLPIGAGVCGKVLKLANTSMKNAGTKYRISKEEHNLATRVYDPSMGMYHYLRRPMSAKERLKFEEKVRNGASRGKTLLEMGLLK